MQGGRRTSFQFVTLKKYIYIKRGEKKKKKDSTLNIDLSCKQRKLEFAKLAATHSYIDKSELKKYKILKPGTPSSDQHHVHKIHYKVKFWM